MASIGCPSCSAPIVFRSSSSVFAACSSCGSTVVRRDVNLELLGKESDVLEDMSPLQVGTSGYYKSKNFMCVGRSRMSWDNGNWNEWYIVFNDNTSGWLAEAQGNYYVMFEAPHSWTSKDTKNWSVGTEIDINGAGTFAVSDIKVATCSGVEGELPFVGGKGISGRFLDISGDNNKFGTIDIKSGEIKLYLGEAFYFDELKFSHLRDLDGW